MFISHAWQSLKSNLISKASKSGPIWRWCGGGLTWRWEFNCAPLGLHLSTPPPPPAHFLNLSGHGLPPAPPLSGAHLMLRSVDKNLRHSSALKRILCDAHNPPFHLMWTQTHAKAWGQRHCLLSSWLLKDLLIPIFSHISWREKIPMVSSPINTTARISLLK